VHSIGACRLCFRLRNFSAISQVDFGRQSLNVLALCLLAGLLSGRGLLNHDLLFDRLCNASQCRLRLLGCDLPLNRRQSTIFLQWIIRSLLVEQAVGRVVHLAKFRHLAVFRRTRLSPRSILGISGKMACWRVRVERRHQRVRFFD